jgi:hypothetical protein
MRAAVIGLSFALLVFSTGTAQQVPKELFPTTSNGKDWGYVDASGRAVIPATFEVALPFFEGMAAVRVNGLYGFIRSDGSFAAPPQYDKVKSFSGGHAAVLRNGRWTYLRPDGAASAWDGAWLEAGSFSAGFAPIRHGDRWGYIDERGRPAFGVTFEESHAFNEGLAAVKLNGKYGFIDQAGRQVIAPAYDQVLDFHEGRAAVRVGARWGYIDPKGTIAIEPRFDAAGPFFNRRADVLTGGVLGEVRANGTVSVVKSPTAPLIPYRISSEPSGATLYTIPVVDYLRMRARSRFKVTRLEQFDIYRRGTTDSTLDLFDQKYMLVLQLGDEMRTHLLDVVAKSTVKHIHVVMR